MPLGTGTQRPVYPRFASQQTVMEDLRYLVDALTRRDRQTPVFPVNRSTPFQISNNTDTWTFDATGASLAETRLVLATLLTYLQNNGVVR